jgi:lipase chaperone LimK
VRRILVATAALALLGAGAWLAQRDARPGAPPTLDRVDAPAAPATAADASAAPEPPLDSLRDTEVDGGLARDAHDRFVPTRDALRLFDYFLSATGEAPDAALRARIVREIAARLPPGAAREAEAFLDRYLAYRAEGARLARDDRLAASADLERRLQWLRELRRAHFGAALAETLFGAEERAAEAALERRRVVEDASLTDAERAARLAALEQELQAAARDAAALPLRLRQEEAALRAAGAGDAEIHAVREASVGAEAAERLARLDRERAEWQLRLAAYRTARDALVADASLAPAERAARLEALRARDFDERERLRVRALDEIELGAAQP